MKYRIKITNNYHYPYCIQQEKLLFGYFSYWETIDAESNEEDARAGIVRCLHRDNVRYKKEQEHLQKLKVAPIINITDEDIYVWKLQGKL